MENKLKPCPLCGGEAILYRNIIIQVHCKNCEFGTCICHSEEEAIERWNHRTIRSQKNYLGISNCPLCGNEEILHTDDGYYKHMFCTKCWASAKGYKTLYEAIDAWKRRAGEE